MCGSNRQGAEVQQLGSVWGCGWGRQIGGRGTGSQAVGYNHGADDVRGVRMDVETQAAITMALDNSIAAVAEEEFQRLSYRLTPNDVAKAIHNALDGLRGLQGCDMPNYDEWVALLYAVWYQPARVNLAFTLARGIPEVVNPIRSNVRASSGGFWCGRVCYAVWLGLRGS